MPYTHLRDLPEQVKFALPKHALEIFRSAFNNAWEEYRDPAKRKGGLTREETAYRVAWAAVKQKYHKNEAGEWVHNPET